MSGKNPSSIGRLQSGQLGAFIFENLSSLFLSSFLIDVMDWFVRVTLLETLDTTERIKEENLLPETG